MPTKRERASENRLLTRLEVAELFKVSPSTVTRWAEAGKLPSVKTLGGHHRYESKTVLELAKHLITEEIVMEKVVFDVPSMYGDHHVVEVRRLLLEMPGVETVYASSAFGAVEVDFDPVKVSADQIKVKLDQSGYLEELSVPVETSEAVPQNSTKKPFMRHTTAYEQGQRAVSFAQTVRYSGRPLWPCPGMGVIEVVKTNQPGEKSNG
jgi:excisionase family DNA binding protein